MTGLKLASASLLTALLAMGGVGRAQPRDLPSSAELMESGSGVPAYIAGVDPAARFPDPATAWLREGRFVSPRNIRQVAPGMTKPQLYALLGEPHFYTPLPFVGAWNYIFDFHTGQGDAFVRCQYQIRFAGSSRVKAAYWRDGSCARFVADSVAAPPPAAPPPPPSPSVGTPAMSQPMAPRHFVVYFQFDRAKITAAALGVIREAADYDHTTPGAHTLVVGFTDTAGSATYNLALSKRRAKAVADALVADGVASDALAVSWKGKTELATPTEDGVREPLNRRATIAVEPAQ